MRAVICDFVRTPFHRAHKGEFAQVRPEDMLNATVSEILARTKVDVNDIEDLMLGCAYPEGVQGLNLGRIATYLRPTKYNPGYDNKSSVRVLNGGSTQCSRCHKHRFGRGFSYRWRRDNVACEKEDGIVTCTRN